MQCSKCGMTWHRSCLPRITVPCGQNPKSFGDSSRRTSVFGVPLYNHLNGHTRLIPIVLDKCVNELQKRGLKVKVNFYSLLWSCNIRWNSLPELVIPCIGRGILYLETYFAEKRWICFLSHSHLQLWSWPWSTLGFCRTRFLGFRFSMVKFWPNWRNLIHKGSKWVTVDAISSQHALKGKRGFGTIWLRRFLSSKYMVLGVS